MDEPMKLSSEDVKRFTGDGPVELLRKALLVEISTNDPASALDLAINGLNYLTGRESWVDKDVLEQIIRRKK